MNAPAHDKPFLLVIQQALEALHDVHTELDVTAYLVDAETRQTIPGAKEGLPEQLFVRDAGGEVELALYLDPAITATLTADNPLVRLHAGNLEPYCIAVEGVSHFVFLVYRAQLDWPVTALELELQAEVDKFVNAWQLLVSQGVAREEAALALGRQLFGGYEIRQEVSADEVERYRVASEAAQRYCEQLTRRFGKDPDGTRLERAVRSYYRTGLAQKLRLVKAA
jgi:hypothetical protein